MARFLKGLGIFLGLIGVGIASAFAVVALLLHQEEVRVPDLAGQDIVTAINTVSQLGLQIKVDRQDPHPTLPRDAVISQSPAAGSKIKKGRQLHVVVSRGPSDSLAPRVVGENFRKADLMIRQAGFLPGDVARTASDTVERDTVVAQQPTAGSPIDKGSTISVLVSTGKRAEVFVMPRLTGKRTDEALKIIDRLGLQHRLRAKASGNRPAGTERSVINQKPAAGMPVAADAMVELVVGK